MRKKSASAPLLPGLLSAAAHKKFQKQFLALAVLCVLFCVSAILKIHSGALSPSIHPALRAATVLQSVEPFDGVPKVAFLFLVRRNVPLDFLWHTFFQNAEKAKFSIHVHSEPGFVLDKTTTRSHFFYGRQLEIASSMGEASMIEAEQLLLKAALQDPANQRFVLLSDSCVPLYNLSYIYNYVMSSPKSFVDSFIDAKEGRYNIKMSPVIPKDKWRKGSQWMVLIRDHAEVLAADDLVSPVFKNYCKRRPAVDAERKRILKRFMQTAHNCIPDEHYVQTLLSMSELEDELERRTLTYTAWKQSKNHMDTHTWHPFTFEYPDVSPEHIKEIKDINHVYYETEYRTEWCQSNAIFVPCFLFARKFSPDAGLRLLNLGLVGPYDPASLSLHK